MTSYVEALERLKKFQDAPEREVTKVTKGAFDTFDTAPRGISPDISPETLKSDRVLRCLWKLYRQHRANLKASGYDPTQARVRLQDWAAACGLSREPFRQMLDTLRSDGRVIHEGHYVRPGVIQECAPEGSNKSVKSPCRDESRMDE